MNKLARDRIVSSFKKQLDDLSEHHDELRMLVHNNKKANRLQYDLSTLFMLQITILWESFIDELLLSYIEYSPGRALRDIERRVKKLIEDKFGSSAKRLIGFDRITKPSATKLSSLLDYKGFNMTPTSAKELSAKANKLLAPQFAKRFSLDSTDTEFYNFIFCLRNYLSHYSKGSRSRLQDCIDSLGQQKNIPLKSSIGRIGSYLLCDVGTEGSRARFIVQQMRLLSQKL